MRLVALGLIIAAAAPAAALPSRELVAPYLQALEARRVGDVEGRAEGLPKRPSAPAAPLSGVSVLIMPLEPEVEARLDAIKSRMRDSITAYSGAYADVVAVRTAYERELLAAGGGELIRGAVSDNAGVLRLDGVPAGEWLLLAWREEAHAVKETKTPPKDASRYTDIPVLTGYEAVSYWKMRVSVRAGETTAIALSDRSVWMTAVREELRHPDAPPRQAGDPKKRR